MNRIKSCNTIYIDSKGVGRLKDGSKFWTFIPEKMMISFWKYWCQKIYETKCNALYLFLLLHLRLWQTCPVKITSKTLTLTSFFTPWDLYGIVCNITTLSYGCFMFSTLVCELENFVQLYNFTTSQNPGQVFTNYYYIPCCLWT